MSLFPSDRQKQLRQSNLITTSRYSMSAIEMNIIFLLIAQLRKDDPVDQVYEVSVKDLEEATKCKINYSRLKEYTFKLRNRGYEIEHGDGYLQIGICASVEYKRSVGVLEIEIARKLRPFLFDLKDNFTTYSLQNALRIKGIYAKRLYQMFCMWRSTGKFIISVRELKYKLDLIDPVTEEEKYPQYGMFKKKVIDAALKEINQLTNVRVQLREKKTGRKITHLMFDIALQGASVTAPVASTTEKGGALYHKDEPRDGRRSLYVRLIEDFQVDAAAVNRIFEKNTYKNITKVLYDVKMMMADKKIANPSAYVLSILDKKSSL